MAERIAQSANIPEVVATTAEGIEIPAAVAKSAVLCENQQVRNVATKASEFNQINQTSVAVLKNGYYEVNGFKFTKYYYEYLWLKGRKAPTLIAKEIVKNATNIKPDAKLTNFFRYEWDNWEMVYNPKTSEIWHLQQLKKLGK